MLYRSGHVVCLLLVLLLMVGCRALPAASPEASPDATPTRETSVPTATLTPVISSEPTDGPSTPYPPAVVDYRSDVGTEVDQAAVLTWQFSEIMDRQSLLDGFRAAPGVTGDLVWLDEQTLTFSARNLAPGRRFVVDLGSDVKSADGLSLSGNRLFSFSTLTPLRVVDVSPGNGIASVRADAPLRVTFNRPVVPWKCVGINAAIEQDCPHPRLRITPEGIGGGVWVHPTVYQFEMQTGLAAGSAYAVTVEAGLTSVEGGMLEEPMTWSFETATPSILATWPTSGQRDIPLTAGISVTFNTPMDQALTGSAFSLVPDDGVPVAGTLTWEDNGAKMRFVPAAPLALDTTYHVRLGERARAVTSAQLENPQAWGFQTVPYPRLIAQTPEDGDRNVGLDVPLRLTFEGAMDEQTLASGVVISSAAGSQLPYGIFDAASGTYSLVWDREPRTEYCVTLKGTETGTVDAGARTDAVISDVYGNALISPAPICFTTGDLPAELTLVRQGNAEVTLDAARPSQFHFTVRNIDRVDFVLTQIDTTALLQQRYDEGSMERQWRETFAPDLNVTTLVTVPLRRLGGALPSGLYSLSWQAPASGDQDQVVAFAVVDMHLTVKLAAQEGLVWVTSLLTGTPASKTAVQLIDDEGLLIAGGTTDDTGLARLSATRLTELGRPVAAVVGTPGEPGFGFALVSWQGDATPEDFGIASSRGPGLPYRVHVQSDRSDYELGDRILLAGWLRTWQGGRLGVPTASVDLVLQLRDPSWQSVYSSTVQTDDAGKFAASLVLPEHISLGNYSMDVMAGLESEGTAEVVRLASADFVVTGHREPRYSIAVTPVSREVFAGETLEYAIAVSSLSGNSDLATDVDWKVTAHQDDFKGTGPTVVGTGWSWRNSSMGARSEMVEQQRVKSDAEGRILVELEAELVDFGVGAREGPQRWTIEAILVEDEGVPVTASADVVLHPADLYLGVRPTPRIAYARERVAVDLVSLTRDMVPSGGQDLAVQLWRRAWRPPATTDEAWEYSDTLVTELSATTGVDGKGSTGFTIAQSGAYIVVAEGVDEGGRVARTEAELWVSGREAAAWRSGGRQLTLVADGVSCSNCSDSAYRPGDVARILVPTVLEGPYQALLTLEREGILHIQHFSLDAPNPVFEVPILDAYSPNVVASVTIVQPATDSEPAQIQVGYVDLPVQAVQRSLSVQVTPDKEHYAPGAVAKLLVQTFAVDGNPVESDLLVSLVNPASASSLEEIFYGNQTLRVATGDSLLVAMEQRRAQLSAWAEHTVTVGQAVAAINTEGAGDGPWERGPNMAQGSPSADDFWSGWLRTNFTGQAEVPIQLPDFAGEWRLLVRAMSDHTQVGEAEVTLQTTQPLYVQLSVPQSVVAGDLAELAAVVYNATSEDLVTDVWIEAGEAFVLMSGEDRQRITIPAGSHRRLGWMAAVAESAGGVVPVGFGASSGVYEAGAMLEGGLMVHRPIVPRGRALIGMMEGRGVEVEMVMVPESAPVGTELVLRMEPSLQVSLYDALLLPDKPHIDTTDTWISYLLPAVASYQALTRLGEIQDADMSTARWVANALDHVYLGQNADGGWGGLHLASDLHLTSYVVYGLLRADAAGFLVRPDVRAAGLAYLRETLSHELNTVDRLPHCAFALYVLSEARVPWPQGTAARLYGDRSLLGTVGTGFLTLALGIADPSDTRVQTLLDEMAAVLPSVPSAAWGTSNGRDWATQCQAASVVVQVMNRLAPAQASTGDANRWLLESCRPSGRKGDYESAWVVTALADHIVQRESVSVVESWQVQLNGVVLSGARLQAREDSGAWIFTAKLEEAGGGLRRGLNVVEITREGEEGLLFYTAHLEQPLDIQTHGMARVGEAHGIVLDRQYCYVGSDVSLARAGQYPSAGHYPLCGPVGMVRVGDLVQVRLVISVPETRYFILLDDPYPAGFEPMSPRGKADAVVSLTGFDRYEPGATCAHFFAGELRPGTYEVTYMLRASRPGTYHSLPGTAEALQAPDLWGSTGMGRVTIQAGD